MREAHRLRRAPWLLAGLRRGGAGSMMLAWVFVFQLLLEGAVALLARGAGAPFSIICTVEGARLPSAASSRGAAPLHDCPLCVAGSCCCLPAPGPLPAVPGLPVPETASAGLLPLPTSRQSADAWGWHWRARAPPA